MSDEIASIRQREKFKTLLRDRGISLRRMSIDLGLNESYFQQFVTYGRPTFVEGKILAQACAYLGVDDALFTPSALMLQEPKFGDESFAISGHHSSTARRSNDSPLVVLPCYDLAQKFDGNGNWRDERFQAQHMTFSRQMLQFITNSHPEDLVLVRVGSDSMSPTLGKGDCAMIDCGRRRANEDGIYAIMHESHMLVKRVSIDPVRKQVTLSHDNPAYPAAREFSLVDIQVEGRVVWTAKKL